jgi:transcriptional regulator of arginine metabolism
MPPTTRQQRERRAAIVRLLSTRSIARQSQLVDLLRAEGFLATQSSVSRDLKELGVMKQARGYRLPVSTSADESRSLRVVAEFVRELRAAGPHLLVLTTAIGAAQRVALTLDRCSWPEVIGTLSGDDTIFIATGSTADQRRLRLRLRDSLKKEVT